MLALGNPAPYKQDASQEGHLTLCFGLISSLDMLGLITARTISKGRYGRSKEINSCIPQNIDPVNIMVESEAELEDIFNGTYKYQTRL